MPVKCKYNSAANCFQLSIFLKVRFILGEFTLVVLGRRCSQFSCVAPFITSKLPCSRNVETTSLVCLCLNLKILSAPKLSDAMAPCGSREGSSSLCQAIPSSPVWYKFRRQELYVSIVFSSAIFFSSSKVAVHGKEDLVMFE